MDQHLDSENGLSINGLSINGLSINGLSINGLSNAAFAGWFDSKLDEAPRLMKYVVRCALPNSASLTYTTQDGASTYTWAGGLGLAPGWARGLPATEAEQQVISACLAAHVNKYGVNVPISVDGRDVLGNPLPISEDEKHTYGWKEGCFFGNLFNGEGLYVGKDFNGLSSGKSSPRICAFQETGKGHRPDVTACAPMIGVGKCGDLCTADKETGAYRTCAYNGKTYPAITTRIKESSLNACGDGICQNTESCGSGDTPDSCRADCGLCPHQADSLVCVGEVSKLSVFGDVTVPDGQSCTLDRVQIGGGVKVGRGSLVMWGGSVARDIEAADAAILEISETDSGSGTMIGGKIEATGVGVIRVSGATIGGDLYIRRSRSNDLPPVMGQHTLTDVRAGGRLLVETGQLVLRGGAYSKDALVTDVASLRVLPNLQSVGTAIVGKLAATRAGSVLVTGAQVGELVIDDTVGLPNGAASNAICGTTVSGTLHVQDSLSTARFDVGAPASCGGSGNTIGGDLKVEDNRGGVTVLQNSVQIPARKIECTHNVPAATGQCSG